MRERAGRKFYVGHSITDTPRANMNIQSIFGDDGFVNDWEAMEALWQYAINSKHLIQDPKENPLILAEPVLNPAKCQIKQAELLFEKFGVPALKFANQVWMWSYVR